MSPHDHMLINTLLKSYNDGNRKAFDDKKIFYFVIYDCLATIFNIICSSLQHLVTDLKIKAIILTNEHSHVFVFVFLTNVGQIKFDHIYSET